MIKLNTPPAEDFINGFFKDFGFTGEDNSLATEYMNGLSVRYMDKDGTEKMLPVESIKDLVRTVYNAGVADGKYNRR